MTNKLRGVLATIALLVCGTLYIKWCHDPQVRAEALQGPQDTRDDSTHQANERWKQQFASREVQRESTLARTAMSLLHARGEIARLKARITPPGGRPAEPQPAKPAAAEPAIKGAGEAESAPPVDSLLAQLATRDTIIAEQDTTIAQLDSTVTIWQAMSADRDERIAQLEAESVAYRTSRDAWKKTATRKGLHVRPCGATILGTNGKVATGAGFCLTWG